MGNKRYVAGVTLGGLLGKGVGIAAKGIAMKGVLPMMVVGALVVKAFFPNRPKQPSDPSDTRTLKQRADAIRAKKGRT